MSKLLDLIKGKTKPQYIADALKKGGGEGSKGGNVIGHTSRGNPIYAPKGPLALHDHHGEHSTRSRAADSASAKTKGATRSHHKGKISPSTWTSEGHKQAAEAHEHAAAHKKHYSGSGSSWGHEQAGNHAKGHDYRAKEHHKKTAIAHHWEQSKNKDKTKEQRGLHAKAAADHAAEYASGGTGNDRKEVGALGEKLLASSKRLHPKLHKSDGDNPDLVKSKYIKRTGTPGHYHYEYAKDRANAGSSAAYSSSSRGDKAAAGSLSGKAAQMVRHQEAANLQRHAAMAAHHQFKDKADADNLRASHAREAARHGGKASEASESLSDAELEEVYHHHQEAKKHGADHDHDHRAHHTISAWDVADQLHERHAEAGNEKEAKRWLGNAEMSHKQHEHHAEQASQAGSPYYKKFKKSVGDDPNLLKTGGVKNTLGYSNEIMQWYTAGGDNA